MIERNSQGYDLFFPRGMFTFNFGKKKKVMDFLIKTNHDYCKKNLSTRNINITTCHVEAEGRIEVPLPCIELNHVRDITEHEL